MNNLGDNPEPKELQALEQSSGVRGEAWEKTLEQAETLAETRREEGWDVFDVAAFHTDPVSPSMGDDEDRFGLVHVIPDNHADRVVELFEENDFTEYQVYGRTVSTYRFQITELLDPETEACLVIASAYERHRMDGLISAARDREVIYTHTKTIDGTPLGVVKHEEYEPFLPEEGS